MTARFGVPLLVALMAMTACRSKSTSGTDASGKRLEPLSASSWLVALDVPGFGQSAVAVPLGAVEPRPVLVALHGGADRPEWACGEWVGVARSHPFVLCPRGVRKPGSPDSDPRYGWGSNAEVAKELRAALAALKHRFGNYVASGPVVVGAFSEGVAPAAQIIEQEPSFFSRVAFVGPTDGAWTAGFAGVFANRGGLRLLVVCTDAACKAAAQADLVFSRGAGTPTKLLEPGDFGRVLDGRVTGVLARELPWLVDGAPFWPSYASAPAPSSSH